MLLAKLKAKADNTYDCTKTLIIYNITKSESNNRLIIHCFEENNDKHTIARNLATLILFIGNHASAHSLQIIVNLADNYSNL